MVVKRETHRDRQARATRTQVAAAARRLFAERGYVATTIAAIAEAADIPAPTIYSAFGGKARILDEIAQGVLQVLLVDEAHAEAMADPDPARGLRAAARLQRRQYELMYDVVTAYLEGSRTDPEIARATVQILTNREQAYHRHLESIVDSLIVPLDTALDIYLAAVLPEVYRTLVVERGWTDDAYETWLGDLLVAQLLGTRRRRRSG